MTSKTLLIQGKIEPPRENRPTVTTNPLPTHAVPPPANINMIEPTLSSWDPSLLITPAGEKGETYGRDMTGIRETYEIEPPPRVHMLRWDDFYDNLPTPEQPLQLLPESPASDESFTPRFLNLLMKAL